MTAARALKSVLLGILLSSEGEKLNSMNLLRYMAPIAVVFLLPATLLIEENVVGITLALAREDKKIIWYLIFNSALAYFVNLTNFLVAKHTNAFTLQDKFGEQEEVIRRTVYVSDIALLFTNCGQIGGFGLGSDDGEIEEDDDDDGILFMLFVLLGSMMQICSAESETIFLETFDENFDGRWVISEKEDYKGEGVISDLNRVVRILRFDVAF